MTNQRLSTHTTEISGQTVTITRFDPKPNRSRLPSVQTQAKRQHNVMRMKELKS